MHGQVFAIVGDPGKLVAFQVIEGIGQGHLAMRVMMAVSFAVGGNVHHLRPVAFRVKTAQQPVRKSFPIHQQVLESDGMRDGSVVEEQADRASGRKVALVSTRRIDPASFHTLPFFPKPVAHPLRLVRTEDGELDSGFAQKLEAFHINGSLRQPHALRIASEAVLEVAHSPHDLSALIARVGQGQDRVVIGLG